MAELLAPLLMIVPWVVAVLTAVVLMVWVERRMSALIQDRRGPNRLGPLGLFQAIADAAKFIFKESLTPAGADRPLYLLAPLLALLPAALDGLDRNWVHVHRAVEISHAGGRGHAFPQDRMLLLYRADAEAR